MQDSEAIDALAAATQRKISAIQQAGKVIGIGLMIVVGLVVFTVCPNDGKIGEYKFLIACGAGLAAFVACVVVARAMIGGLVREFERTTGIKV